MDSHILALFKFKFENEKVSNEATTKALKKPPWPRMSMELNIEIYKLAG